MTIAVDFDGVLCDMVNVAKGYKMGPPMPGALASVKELSKTHRLIVHTVRATSMPGQKAVYDWLEFFEFPMMNVTAVKPNADVYLDDKAVRFTSWEDVSF